MSYIFLRRNQSVAPLTWFADFRTALGNSVPAIGDGGKFSTLVNVGANVNVIAAPMAGFPMPNVLDIDMSGVGVVPARNVIRDAGAWGLPAVGESLYRRSYFSNNRPIVGGVTDHPLQAHANIIGTGCCAFAAELRFNLMQADATFQFEFATSGDGAPNFALHRWLPPARMPSLTVFRWEDCFTRIADIANYRLYNYRAFIFQPAVSESVPLYRWDAGPVIPGGAQLAFQCSQGAHGNPPPTPHNLGQATPPVIGMPTTCAGDPCLLKLMVCQQGNGQGINAHDLWGGFAVNGPTTDPNAWCGPWTLARG